MTKEILIDYVKSKGIYDTVDDMMIDELLYNQELIAKAKEDIKTTGIMIDVGKGDNVYWQQSPAISIYNNAVKNVLNLSRKLALSPLDRANLKLGVTDGEDGF